MAGVDEWKEGVEKTKRPKARKQGELFVSPARFQPALDASVTKRTLKPSSGAYEGVGDRQRFPWSRAACHEAHGSALRDGIYSMHPRSLGVWPEFVPPEHASIHGALTAHSLAPSGLGPKL